MRLDSISAEELTKYETDEVQGQSGGGYQEGQGNI
mgnify:CR=1 FL=1